MGIEMYTLIQGAISFYYFFDRIRPWDDERSNN